MKNQQKSKADQSERQALYDAIVSFEEAKDDLKYFQQRKASFSLIHGQRYSRIGSRPTGTGDPTVSAVRQMDELNEELRQASQTFKKAEANLNRKLEAVPDAIIRQIVTERYIKEHTWQVTAWNVFTSMKMTTVCTKLKRYFNNGQPLPKSIKLFDD